MSYPNDFSDCQEAGFYLFTEDTQLEMIQLRDRMAMYADMLARPPAEVEVEVEDRPVAIGVRELQACFRSLASEMTRLLDSGHWRPA